MFDEWRERLQLKREIASLEKELAEEMIVAKYAGTDSDSLQPSPLRRHLYSRKQQFDAIETGRLMRKVLRLGIELPSKSKWWWDNLDEEGPDNFNSFLTDVGKAGVSKLIREERRKNIEWWVKTLTPLFGALISLLSLLIALISVSKK